MQVQGYLAAKHQIFGVYFLLPMQRGSRVCCATRVTCMCRPMCLFFCVVLPFSLLTMSSSQATSRTASRLSRTGLPLDNPVNPAASRLSVPSEDRSDDNIGPVGIKDIGLQLVTIAETEEKVINQRMYTNRMVDNVVREACVGEKVVPRRFKFKI